jgi:hypothetical protein
VQARHPATAQTTAAGSGPPPRFTCSQFGCAARHSRGLTACSNKTTTSDLGLNAAVLRALRSHLASPAVESWVAEVVAAREAESQAPDAAAEVAAAEAKVEKVADALARIGFSETLARRLKTEEAKLAEARAQLARAAPASKRPKVPSNASWRPWETLKASRRSAPSRHAPHSWPSFRRSS